MEAARGGSRATKSPLGCTAAVMLVWAPVAVLVSVTLTTEGRVVGETVVEATMPWMAGARLLSTMLSEKVRNISRRAVVAGAGRSAAIAASRLSRTATAAAASSRMMVF